MTIASLIVDVGTNTVEFVKGIDAAQKRLDRLTDAIDTVGKGAMRIGAGLTAALTVPIAAVGAAAVKMGMDAVESENLMAVSFGDMKKSADDWAAGLSKNFGLNRFETEKTAGVLFNMTTGMGLGRKAAFEMSTGVVKLAADMASFRNIPMEEALRKIQSGLTGETEPLKAIGILVDDNTIKAYAYTHGIAEQGKELSQQQKVLARWGAILQQTANDQGDLARTLDSPANQLRIMKSRIEEATTSLGVALVPMISTVIGLVVQLVPYLQRAVEWFVSLSPPVKTAAVVVAGLVAAIGPAIFLFGTLATSVGALLPLLASMGVTVAGAAAAASLLAGAVAAVAVAAASWKVGRWIGEASGLTDWVERTTGHVMGLSDAEINAGMAARKYADAHRAAAAPVANLSAEMKSAQEAMANEIAAQQAAATAAAATAEATKHAEQAAKEHAKALDDIRRAQIPLTESQKLGVAQLLAQNIAVSDIAEKYHVSAVAVSNYAEALKRSEDTAKDWLKLHVELAQMAHKLQLDVFDKMTAARNAEAQARAADQDTQLKMLTDFHERNYQATLSSTERELRLNELARQQAILSLKGRFDIESDLYKNAEQEINQFYSGQAATIAVAYDEMDQTVTTLGKKIVANLKDTLLQIPQLLANTLGHGDVGGAVKGTASMVGAAAGGVIGKAMGGPMGAAIGSALGSLAGPLVGQIGKWLGIGATEYEKRMRAAAAATTKLHQELLTSHGGMAQLILDADLVGINIKAAFNWKDPEAFKNVVSDLDQKTQLLNSAMQEYGFTWEDLGEKARGAKLSQLFDDLYAKTDILRTAGIDYHTILERQAGDYSKLVQAAIRTGTEIPAAMQQTLQDLVEMGKLVDENGVAFTDLSDIHWAKTLTQGFDEVTDAIHELTDALTRGVGGALDDIGRRVVHPRIEPVYGDSGDVGGAATGGIVGFGRVLPFARGGFVPHGTDTVPAMLTPGEIVLNAAQQKNVSDAMGGDIVIHQTITLDGKVIDERTERHARRMAQTGRIRQRAAAGRSY